MKSEVMDAATLNRKLAEALGWTIGGAGFFWIWQLPDGSGVNDFSPATSSDHLRLYVLPEVERRGLTQEYEEILEDDCYNREPVLDVLWYLLTASPSVLAAAALKVLEASK